MGSRIMDSFQSENDDKMRLRSNPFMALNLLAYKRNGEVPDGRSEYHMYADRVQKLVQAKLPRPSGLCCCITPCMTISGEKDWDEMVIMQYPNLKEFVGMTDQPEYMEIVKNRDMGLLHLGLVFVEPQLVNGSVIRNRFRLSEDGDSEGLAQAEPSLQSK